MAGSEAVSPRVDADIAIVGGGCAGLSLAAQLAVRGTRARVAVIEPRTLYSNDRTWSGWSLRPHLFEACVSAKWRKWRVQAGRQQVACGDGRCVYQTIESDAFYARACELMAGNRAIRLHGGVTAHATGADADSAWVETSAGRLRAGVVIDTRPPRATPGHGLLQSFLGCVVETDSPRFDPSTVELMMFDPPANAGITFLYGLPFSPTRALIELTRLTPGPAAIPTEAELSARLAARLPGGYVVCRMESGVLAMNPALPARPAHPRLIALGTLSGAARPSTGYAFGAIQAHAESLAARLQGGVAAALGWRAPRLPVWMRAMDRLFLRVLRNDPACAPGLFCRLFERCPTPPLTRFLSGGGGLLDAARVAACLPPSPFLANLLTGART